MSLLNKNPRHEYKDSKHLPGPFLSLGWLLGFFRRASARSLVTLVTLVTVSFLWFRKGGKKLKESNEIHDKPRSQENNTQPQNSKSQIPKPPIDISQLPNQRFVARKRNERGQLKHIATFNHPPTKKDLEPFGPGDYSILTTKPSLKQWTRIHVEPEKELQKQKPRKVKEERDFAPISASIKLSSSNIGSKNNRGLRETKHELKKSSISETEIPSQPIQEKITPRGDVLQLLKTQKNAYKQPLNEPESPQTVEKSRLRPEPYQPQDRSTTEPQLVTIEAEENKAESKLVIEKTIECYKCGEDLTWFTKCEFCQEIYCDEDLKDCYKLHYCPESYVCIICSKRTAFEETTISPFCNKAYCSVRCLTKCLEKNEYNPECMPCVYGDLVEKEKSECTKCGTQVNNTDTYCPECSDELEREDVDEEEYDCDGDCSDCTNYDCEDRCKRKGKCKGCPDYDDCSIRCVKADDDCEKWICNGFDCEECIVEISNEDEDSEVSEDEDIDDEGWEESDEN